MKVGVVLGAIVGCLAVILWRARQPAAFAPIKPEELYLEETAGGIGTSPGRLRLNSDEGDTRPSLW